MSQEFYGYDTAIPPNAIQRFVGLLPGSFHLFSGDDSISTLLGGFHRALTSAIHEKGPQMTAAGAAE
jgi:hypothetical protein